MALFIPVILGTARKGREAEKVAKLILQKAKESGLETELIDVRDYMLPETDNTQTSPVAKRLAEKIERADGLVIVSPEYNHGYPGELKMMLDLLYEQYARKPVGICGVSSGMLGGARMVEQLRLVCIEFHMVPIREALYFPGIKTLFDEKGGLKDEAAYGRKIDNFFSELIWYARALKVAREKG